MRSWIFFGFLLLAAGCGERATPPPPPATGGAAQSAPTASEPSAKEPARAELCPLRLSLLNLRPGTVFYMHDPRQDPGGSLWDRSHPVRDVYRPEGTYLLGFERRGYERVEVKVRLTSKGTEPPLESIRPEFKAGAELVAQYRAAEEALAARDPNRARAALDAVRKLDESYGDTAGLLRRLAEVEKEIEQEKQALEAARECLRKGDLAGAGRAEALRERIAEVERARAEFDAAVARFDIDAAKTTLARLRESLTPADPANRGREERIEDLKSVLALLRSLEQICLDPKGVRERLGDLFHPDAAARAAALADEIARFCRDAKYLSMEHEPTSFASGAGTAEVRARLRVRYSVQAGEKKQESEVVVTLRKSGAWKIAAYGRAQ